MYRSIARVSSQGRFVFLVPLATRDLLARIKTLRVELGAPF